MTNFEFQGSPVLVLFSVVTALLGVVSTVFWMVVGWRAMRAHERISRTLEDRLRGP